MGANTAISWADDTWNPWEGCQKVSPACDGCYAEARNLRYAPKGATEAPNWGPGAPRRRTSAANWGKPLKWDKEQAAKIREAVANDNPLPPPRFVFCASLADVFDNAVPPEWRRDLFDLIRATPNLVWLLLTKRPGNIGKLFEATYWNEPGPIKAPPDWRWPRNAAIGCTVVTQEEADRDIPKLLAAKAALNPAFAFVSMEPLLGRVDLTRVNFSGHLVNALTGRFANDNGRTDVPALDWVIVGGETDQKTEEGVHLARPADPAWYRSLRDQCAAAGVPFHFKQWGEWQPVRDGRPVQDGDHIRVDDAKQQARVLRRYGKANDPRTLDGVRHDARPQLAA